MPRATIEEENAGGSAEVDDLLPDREGINLPTDTFNNGEGPTVEMEPEEEAEVPAEGEGETPDREAEVPKAAAATSGPSVESPAAKRAASPVREERRAQDPVDAQKKDETPDPVGPGVPISYAPKYTDDDGDLRDTAATPKAASTQESRGGHTQLNCEHALPGAPGGSARAETSGGSASP